MATATPSDGRPSIGVLPYEPAAATPNPYRWAVCGLLFAVTTINYIDRSVFTLLKPILEQQFHWDMQRQYGMILVAFQVAYALGLLLVGGVIDRVGVKRGLMLAVILWGSAAAAHGFMAHIPADAHLQLGKLVLGFTGISVMGFAAARAALGFAESANFPSAIKGVSEWFPVSERSLATGLFNCGASVGAMTAPFFVPWIAVHFGWQYAFYCTATIDLIWVLAWIMLYRNPQPVAVLKQDRVPWSRCFFRRQTIAYGAAKFMTDPIWWFYLFWVPDFLLKRHHILVTRVGPPLMVIYCMTTIGSIGGGWISSNMIHRGFSVNLSRKTALLICALCVVPVFAITHVASLWIAVPLVGLAAAAHQGFSANLFTIVSDTVPKAAVSSVVGIGGMAGAVGSIFFTYFVAYILDLTHNNYAIPFLICSTAYLIGLLVLHLILPRLEQMHSGGEPRGFPVVMR